MTTEIEAPQAEIEAPQCECVWPDFCPICKAKRVPYTLRRFTLSELHADPQNMIAWLGHDGNVPTVQVQTVASRMRWGSGYGAHGKTEEKPVNDKETLDQWWHEYRSSLHWVSPYKPKTDKQFMAECCSSLGFKKGTVDARLKQAREEMLKVGTVVIPNPYLNKTPLEDVMLDPCPHCGKEIDCTALRCSHCGTDL